MGPRFSRFEFFCGSSDGQDADGSLILMGNRGYKFRSKLDVEFDLLYIDIGLK